MEPTNRFALKDFGTCTRSPDYYGSLLGSAFRLPKVVAVTGFEDPTSKNGDSYLFWEPRLPKMLTVTGLEDPDFQKW